MQIIGVEPYCVIAVCQCKKLAEFCLSALFGSLNGTIASNEESLQKVPQTTTLANDMKVANDLLSNNFLREM